jgi:hypothetical protein
VDPPQAADAIHMSTSGKLRSWQRLGVIISACDAMRLEAGEIGEPDSPLLERRQSAPRFVSQGADAQRPFSPESS